MFFCLALGFAPPLHAGNVQGNDEATSVDVDVSNEDERIATPDSNEEKEEGELVELDGQNAEIKLHKPTPLGVTFASKDGRFKVNPWLRGQFRFSDPFDSDPRNSEEFQNEPGAEFKLRRARFKMEGHLFTPKLGFYLEHELTGDQPLLDLRLDIELRDDLDLRIGQHKVIYNRERVDSSGKQQFVERSIATYAFTLDRQRGITAAKHWAEGTRLDNWLMVGLMEGDGRDPGPRGSEPMVLARWQWEFLGRDLPFSQSDLKFRWRPAATLAFAASRVRGPYTRFSSSGGGQLDGFQSGGDERYTLSQWMQEFAWQYSGLSIQQEFHVKYIEDHETGERSRLTGGYAQFGKAWAVLWHKRAFALEAAIRVARVDWETEIPDRVQNEITLVGNLFFNGHNNKLTADLSRIGLDDAASGKDDDIRVRLQWDISF